MSDKIQQIEARIILDSRGEKTVEVSITAGDQRATAACPQGKSRGSGEAVFRPAAEAVMNIQEEIVDVLIGRSVFDQIGIDKAMIELDGTDDKSRLGANAILPVSLALAKVAAKVKGQQLWRYLRELSATTSNDSPRLLVNLINGGLHAGNDLMFQEYLAILPGSKMTEAVNNSTRLYKKLGEKLVEQFGPTAINLGDEGGFAPLCSQDEEPFKLIMETADDLGLVDTITVGLDAAADNLSKNDEELIEFYHHLVETYPLEYLEDPFQEDKPESFSQLKNEIGNGVLIVGDDLTVTNPERLVQPEITTAINGVIVKPNQIGSLSETLEAIKLTQAANWAVIISHRSGETNDDFIADLAFGVGAWGIKLGSPARGERVAKYNRLLAIDQELVF